jgi:hypothetical protein
LNFNTEIPEGPAKTFKNTDKKSEPLYKFIAYEDKILIKMPQSHAELHYARKASMYVF